MSLKVLLKKDQQVVLMLPWNRDFKTAKSKSRLCFWRPHLFPNVFYSVCILNAVVFHWHTPGLILVGFLLDSEVSWQNYVLGVVRLIWCTGKDDQSPTVTGKWDVRSSLRSPAGCPRAGAVMQQFLHPKSQSIIHFRVKLNEHWRYLLK